MFVLDEPKKRGSRPLCYIFSTFYVSNSRAIPITAALQHLSIPDSLAKNIRTSKLSHQAEFSAVFQRHRRPWLKLFSNLISASIFYRNFYYFCTGYAIVRLRNILMKVFSLYP